MQNKVHILAGCKNFAFIFHRDFSSSFISKTGLLVFYTSLIYLTYSEAKIIGAHKITLIVTYYLNSHHFVFIIYRQMLLLLSSREYAKKEKYDYCRSREERQYMTLFKNNDKNLKAKNVASRFVV